MTFADVEAKTTFLPFFLEDGKEGSFSQSDIATIIDAMRTAYDGSPTAKAIFDNFIAVPGNVITIGFTPDKFEVPNKFKQPGLVELDLSWLNGNTYITKTGEEVKDTPLSAIVHELGHALGGYSDKKASPDEGYNVEFVNKMFRELHIPEQASYEAYKLGNHDSPPPPPPDVPPPEKNLGGAPPPPAEDAGTAGGDTPPPEAPLPQFLLVYDDPAYYGKLDPNDKTGMDHWVMVRMPPGSFTPEETKGVIFLADALARGGIVEPPSDAYENGILKTPPEDAGKAGGDTPPPAAASPSPDQMAQDLGGAPPTGTTPEPASTPPHGKAIDVINHESYNVPEPGPGDHVMSGQAGFHDVFVFNPPFGNYEITNFDPKEDIIYLPEGYFFHGENNADSWSFDQKTGADLTPVGGTLTIDGQKPMQSELQGSVSFVGPWGHAEPDDLTPPPELLAAAAGDTPPPDVSAPDQKLAGDLPKPPPPPDVPPPVKWTDRIGAGTAGNDAPRPEPPASDTVQDLGGDKPSGDGTTGNEKIAFSDLPPPPDVPPPPPPSFSPGSAPEPDARSEAPSPGTVQDPGGDTPTVPHTDLSFPHVPDDILIA